MFWVEQQLFFKRQVIRRFSERRVSPVCEHVKSTNIYHSFNACKQIKKRLIHISVEKEEKCMHVDTKKTMHLTLFFVK